MLCFQFNMIGDSFFLLAFFSGAASEDFVEDLSIIV